MKCLLDMGISIHLAPALRADGHEAAHMADLSDGTLPDSEILARARQEGSVLLVHDLGFPPADGREWFPLPFGHRLPDEEHAAGERPELPPEAITTAKESLEQGAIVSVTEGAIRVRLVPVRDA